MDRGVVKKTTDSLMILVFLVVLVFVTSMMSVITTFRYTTVNGKEVISTVASSTSYIWMVAAIIFSAFLVAALVMFIFRLKRFKSEMKNETSSAEKA
ncbi:MAG: hypothetical protein M1431_02020 [Candidatus Thermoplasmatota archaeon]|nr:hypothetical protein [Candidatus Thermoplasmatota archaeon]